MANFLYYAYGFPLRSSWRFGFEFSPPRNDVEIDHRRGEPRSVPGGGITIIDGYCMWDSELHGWDSELLLREERVMNKENVDPNMLRPGQIDMRFHFSGVRFLFVFQIGFIWCVIYSISFHLFDFHFNVRFGANKLWSLIRWCFLSLISSSTLICIKLVSILVMFNQQIGFIKNLVTYSESRLIFSLFYVMLHVVASVVGENWRFSHYGSVSWKQSSSQNLLLKRYESILVFYATTFCMFSGFVAFWCVVWIVTGTW